MTSRGSTTLGDAFYQTIKTYVDGVELADPAYLGLIDPNNIDHIEILTGPQASTIYGSNAINRVMQVFTKRGTTSKPQLIVNLESGVVQNAFSAALAPQHNYFAQLSGVEGHLSYNVGGSWSHTGPWAPSVHLTNFGGSGGLQFRQGAVTVDANFRRLLATNQQGGNQNQRLFVNENNGTYTYNGNFIAPVFQTLSSGQQTIGTTITWAPFAQWSHSATLGVDELTSASQSRAPGYKSPSDTNLTLSQGIGSRTSFAYSTTTRIPLIEHTDATITLGADGWQTMNTSMSATSPVLTGPVNASSQSITRQPNHNRGAFAQGQMSMWETLFLTYGLRAEWNPNYGSSANPDVVPRYGAVLAQTFGALTAKLRAAYGHSTRPPSAGQAVAKTLLARGYGSAVPIYGNIDDQLANPDLTPEQQQGGEGGVELYLGSRASLTVTRYNQTVDHLIASAVVDSSPSLIPDPYGDCSSYPPDCGYLYWIQTKNLSLGSVRNQGWETQGTVTLGPLNGKGTYSWVKSRIIGLDPRYLTYSVYTRGAAFVNVPEHTWALQLFYSQAATSISLDVQGQGPMYSDNARGNMVQMSILDTRLLAEKPRVRLPSVSSSNYGGPDVSVILMRSWTSTSGIRSMPLPEGIAYCSSIFPCVLAADIALLDRWQTSFTGLKKRSVQ